MIGGIRAGYGEKTADKLKSLDIFFGISDYDLLWGEELNGFIRYDHINNGT